MMNALGLTMILKMGNCCIRETIDLNGNKYRVIERLGEGGFSTVDLVEAKRSKQKYALKRATCHSIEDQKRVEREIGFLTELRHPNIMTLVDSSLIGSADIVVNLTSEALLLLPYYPRGTLHDYLMMRSKEQSHLDGIEIFRIFQGICEAVKYIHELKPDAIAHRDLKTANVCFTNDFTPVLIDLGSMDIARVQIRGSQDARKLMEHAAEYSSLPYRPPELFNVIYNEGQSVIDERTDIWSLGCILYALCYYFSPFDMVYMRGGSIALAVLSNVPFPNDNLYPDEVHDLIMFMLNPNPSERPFIQNVIEKTEIVANSLGNVA